MRQRPHGQQAESATLVRASWADPPVALVLARQDSLQQGAAPPWQQVRLFDSFETVGLASSAPRTAARSSSTIPPFHPASSTRSRKGSRSSSISRTIHEAEDSA